MKNQKIQNTKFGWIGIEEETGNITRLYWSCAEDAEKMDRITNESIPLLTAAFLQLNEYLAGLRREFDLPLAPGGTEFMRKVWRELQNVPYGEVVSYQEIARRIGNSGAMRAVGQANHRNPIPIFIPCHRIIGASGKLVGYGGGLERKQWLLALEKAKIFGS